METREILRRMLDLMLAADANDLPHEEVRQKLVQLKDECEKPEPISVNDIVI